MLTVLALVDIVMIANLLLMVVVGGYEIFVARLHLEGHPDRPQWLSHINANVLKLKLAMAIVGITSVHLLQTFIEQSADTRRIKWDVVIHLAFVGSALVLAVINRLDEGSHPREATEDLPEHRVPPQQQRAPTTPVGSRHAHRRP